MVAPAVAIKSNAQKMLKGNMQNGVIVSAVLIALCLIVTTVCSLFSVAVGETAAIILDVLLWLTLLFPLLLGAIRYIKRLVSGIKEPLSALFYYFSKKSLYLRAELFIWSLSVRTAIIALVSLLPAIILNIMSSEWIYRIFSIDMPLFATNLWMPAKVFTFLGVVAFVLISVKYYLAPFIFISNSAMDIFEIINMSSVISKRTYFDFISLVISVIVWILLSFFIIPLLILFPYLTVCYMIHSALAVEQYNNVVDSFNDKNAAPFYSAD